MCESWKCEAIGNMQINIGLFFCKNNKFTHLDLHFRNRFSMSLIRIKLSKTSGASNELEGYDHMTTHIELIPLPLEKIA